jgi:hypothetical protein
MAIIDRIIESLGGVTQAEAYDRARAAEAAAHQDMGNDEPVSGTVKSQGYKGLASSAVRGLGLLDYGKVMDTAWKLYLLNPLARRGLEVKRDYIVGKGVTLHAENETLQEILSAFMDDNQLEARLRDFVLQQRLLGEQCYPVFVRKSGGRVRLGYIDPAEIEKVVTHPDNALERWAVVLKEQTAVADPWAKAAGRRVYRIVREAEAVVDEETGKAKPTDNDGRLLTDEQAELEAWEKNMLKNYGLTKYTRSCFYFAVNALSNQERGYSDLLTVADWCDMLYDTLRALVRREQIADYFLVTCRLEGADEDRIKEKQRKLTANPPRKGSVNVVNEKETWDIVQPDLKQPGSIETVNLLITFILGGLGIPRHWYGFGDDTNRATAEAQGSPTWRTMEQAQDAARDVLLAMGNFVRDQAIIAGASKIKDDDEIEAVMPAMTIKDVQRITAGLAQLVQAIVVAVQQEWLSNKTARAIVANQVSELGIEISPTDEEEAIEEEAAVGDEKTAASNSQALTDALAQQQPQGEPVGEDGNGAMPEELASANP